MKLFNKYRKTILGILAIIIGIGYFYYKANKQSNKRDIMIEKVFKNHQKNYFKTYHNNIELVDSVDKLSIKTTGKCDFDLLLIEEKLRTLLREKLNDEYYDDISIITLFNKYIMLQKIEDASPDVIVLSFNFFSKIENEVDNTERKKYDNLSKQLFFLIESKAIFKFSKYYDIKVMRKYYIDKIRKELCN